MFRHLITLSLILSLSLAHDGVNIAIQQNISGVAMDHSHGHGHGQGHGYQEPKPFDQFWANGEFNIEAYRHYSYPYVRTENDDYVCKYWSCREYPCRCMLKEPRCEENYTYDADHKKCMPTDHCLSVFKGCGAGEVFSYESCECECYIECASDEIRLPEVCLCGKGTFPVYNHWAVGRYFGEKQASKGFNK